MMKNYSRQKSRDMTKPTKWVCVQRRLRSPWASAQSDQSLRCPHEESYGPKLPTECTTKTLIRLGGCSSWSESSLGANSFCWFWHGVAQNKDVCLRSTLYAFMSKCYFEFLPALIRMQNSPAALSSRHQAALPLPRISTKTLYRHLEYFPPAVY